MSVTFQPPSPAHRPAGGRAPGHTGGARRRVRPTYGGASGCDDHVQVRQSPSLRTGVLLAHQRAVSALTETSASRPMLVPGTPWRRSIGWKYIVWGGRQRRPPEGIPPQVAAACRRRRVAFHRCQHRPGLRPPGGECLVSATAPVCRGHNRGSRRAGAGLGLRPRASGATRPAGAATCMPVPMFRHVPVVPPPPHAHSRIEIG